MSRGPKKTPRTTLANSCARVRGDRRKTLARSSFPIKPDALVGKAKHVMSSMFGTLEPDVLADDFRFVAPVVGPLGKEEFPR